MKLVRRPRQIGALQNCLLDSRNLIVRQTGIDVAPLWQTRRSRLFGIRFLRLHFKTADLNDDLLMLCQLLTDDMLQGELVGQADVANV